MKVAIAFDVEGRGSDAMRHGIVSIGVCIGRLDRKEVLHQARFDFKPLPFLDYQQETPTLRQQDFEPRCMEEFWSKHMDKLKIMQENARDPLDQIRAFRSLIDMWDDRKEWEAVLMCDNMVFDAHMINHYLSAANLPPLNYDQTWTKYRSVYDTHAYLRGLEKMTDYSKWVSDSAIIQKYGLPVSKEDHDHMPENDARFIYEFHVSLLLVLRENA